jgi:hypothetical protein
MKSIVAVILLAFIAGCAPPAAGPAMQGQPVDVRADAYVKMCVRDPDSPLCPSDELGVTDSRDLNAQWCRMCSINSSYSWCKYFQECIKKDAPTPPPSQTIEPAGETMQGRAVRIRAQAYEDMCNRTPKSVLCK